MAGDEGVRRAREECIPAWEPQANSRNGSGLGLSEGRPERGHVPKSKGKCKGRTSRERIRK